MSSLLIYLITLFFFLYNNENTYHIQLKNNSSYVIKHDGNFTQYFSLLPFFISTKQKNLYLFFLLTYGRKLSFLSSLYLFILSQMKLLSFSPKWSLNAGVLYIGNTIPNFILKYFIPSKWTLLRWWWWWWWFLLLLLFDNTLLKLLTKKNRECILCIEHM